MTTSDASINVRNHAPHQEIATKQATGPLSEGLLRKTFLIDRAVVFASTVGLVVLSGVIGSLLDWPTWVVAAIGAAFVPYAGLMQWLVAGARFTHPLAMATMVADFGWVVASFLAIVFLSDDASGAAPWVLGLQALVIADIGLAKLVGFRRASR